MTVVEAEQTMDERKGVPIAVSAMNFSKNHAFIRILPRTSR